MNNDGLDPKEHEREKKAMQGNMTLLPQASAFPENLPQNAFRSHLGGIQRSGEVMNSLPAPQKPSEMLQQSTPGCWHNPPLS